jgi:N-sulfoglucosamine sulfohydrolase
MNNCWGLFCFALLCSVAESSSAAETSKPNILFCIADDWSWPHAGAYGDKVVKTPTFDRVAKEGALFTHAFCASPSCTPSRAAILTGRYPHQLREGGNLWGFLPRDFAVFPDLLAKSGYVIGLQGKGWGPGDLAAGGWKNNPAGPPFKGFEQFLKTVPAGRPFCFWFGSSDAHRPYKAGGGLEARMKADDVTPPECLPGSPEVRNDIMDYYFEVQRFDQQVGTILKLLESAGQLENTIVVITSDNGMPFPRCKANLYDSGCRMPLAIRWAKRWKGGKTVNDLVSLIDLAPTFLESAGVKPPAGIAGKSLLPLLDGTKHEGREMVFFERERHANVRKGDVGYPSRALRTRDFLYIRNFRPDRWPAGDPTMWKAVGAYGDVDESPSKTYIVTNRAEANVARFFDLAFAKRPAEELYDLSKDPGQIKNVAGDAAYADTQKRLAVEMDRWLKDTKDPRAGGGGDEFEKYPYFGRAPRLGVNRDQLGR